MSKKVVVVNGSPRKKGNSNLLCEQFATGAKQAGHEVEHIFTAEKNINYCAGCHVCYGGKKNCPQADDMLEILESLVQADVIVLATPVYFYTMSGQMKTFVDRICGRYRELSNKEFYFIMTAAEDDKAAMTVVIEEFKGLLSCLDNPVEKGIIYGTGVWQTGEVKDKPAMQLAYSMGVAL